MASFTPEIPLLIDFHREALDLRRQLPRYRINVLLFVHLDEYRGLIPRIDFAGDDRNMRDFHQLGTMPLADRFGIVQILRGLLCIRRLRPGISRDARHQRNRNQHRRNFLNLHC